MVNPFKRKNFIPFLGFLPSEIRFQNGNGNGDGDAGISLDLGGGFSLDLSTGGLSLGAEPGQCEVSTGITGAGEAPSSDLNEASYSPDFTGYAFEASPSVSEPSASPDLSEAFSPAYSPQISPEEGAPITGTTSAFAREGFFDLPHGGLTQQGATFTGGLIDIGLGLLGMFTGIFGALGVALGQLTSKSFEGKTLGPTIAGKFQATSFPAVNVQAQPSVKSSTQPSAQPSAQPSTKGTPITLSPYTGSKTEGNLESVLSLSSAQKAPSSYPSTYYAKTPPQSLSTSLFGVTEKVTAKEGGGLMIFPSSASGIEKEGSSLLKKQEPVIDSTSMLFLLGMGVVGMVLRKGARA